MRIALLCQNQSIFKFFNNELLKKFIKVKTNELIDKMGVAHVNINDYPWVNLKINSFQSRET